jgi:molybdopterin-synthase adenylyltransferase
MMNFRSSVAMTGDTDESLRDHLLRDDGQEDICIATYRPSTGIERRTALLNDLLLPGPGERTVHGNASFTGDYIVRAAVAAASKGAGIALLHSHPGATGWQRMSACDADAESSYAHLVHAMTGLPLLGMTLAGGDRTWSAREWSSDGLTTWSESVRVVAEHLQVSWNDALRPPPRLQPTQLRTASGWGERVQADITRLRVLVIGVGSVGLDVALRLAASGIEHVGVMDFDNVETKNLDRLIGATVQDVVLHRAKIDVARRLLLDGATAEHPTIAVHRLSVCEPDGHALALDYDIIFSCVDRPWARAVLNTIAYADYIPIVDGGIHIDAFPDQGMRNATWRSHVIRPGRPCLVCNKQLDPGAVALDRDGLLDDPAYIAGADRTSATAHQNVAALSISVAASLLAQFVSLVAAPGGQGEPGPLQYSLSTHTIEHLPYLSRPNCFFEKAAGSGDARIALTGRHKRADEIRAASDAAHHDRTARLGRIIDEGLDRLGRIAAHGLRRASARARRVTETRNSHSDVS